MVRLSRPGIGHAHQHRRASAKDSLKDATALVTDQELSTASEHVRSLHYYVYVLLFRRCVIELA